MEKIPLLIEAHLYQDAIFDDWVRVERKGEDFEIIQKLQQDQQYFLLERRASFP